MNESVCNDRTVCLYSITDLGLLIFCCRRH